MSNVLRYNMLNQSRFSGFTLAEVLITLGIISVVAAMTLPSLMNKIQKRDTAARLKKFYSAMNRRLTGLPSITASPVTGLKLWYIMTQVLCTTGLINT